MTNVILPSRRPYGSPYYSPNSRPIYYGGNAAYPLSFSALGLTGVAGYVYDGTVSRAWTDNGAKTLASASGTDTVAVWEDMSGNGSNATMAATANRPVFYSAGGIASARGGTISGVVRAMDVPALGDIAAYTAYLIVRSISGGATYSQIPLILAQSGGTFFYEAREATAPPNTWATYTPTGSNNYLGPAVDSVAGILKVRYAGGNKFGKGTLNMSAAFGATYTTSWVGDINITGGQILSYLGGATYEQCESPFIFVAASEITDGSAADDTILTYMRDNFRSW